jgi:transcriptional regulator with XRE-family HTH domain
MESKLIDDWKDRAFRLKESRERAGLTVQEVATRANLDRTTISTYESRRARPSADALGRWEKAVIELARERLNDARIVLNDLDADLPG